MDPLSQGVVGAVVPQSFFKKKSDMLWGFIFSFLGGMAPDLDVLITSSSDSLLSLEYHRQFTHSLVFIPFGGFICALVLHQVFKKPLNFKMTYLYTTLGYATHGLLDACTSYGTQLYWPFSDTRVSWDNISIIDPLFTLPVLVLSFLALKKRKVSVARLALAYGLFYLLFGVFQRQRAISVGLELAKKRGHEVIQIHGKPSFANLILWKIIYERDGFYHSDAVRLGFNPVVTEGENLPLLDVKKDLPWLKKGSQQAIDIERFRWFSQGFIAMHPKQENFIIDVRYSFLPYKMSGLWGIQLNPLEQSKHAEFMPSDRNVTSELLSEFMDLLVGK